ncbi:L-amino acid N-acyltransferase YncA [bacterium A37T11]|nr:L-amino acid N-acyltransferase YncA [bacterium A37T11]
MVIRKAVREDCLAMLTLVHELADYEKAPQEVTVSLSEMEDAGFGPEPVWEAFVADEGGELLGMALFYIRYSTWKGRRIFLEDLIVTSEKRGKGIGKLLFERVWTECQVRGYEGMTWQVLDWNEPAINFYRKYGANFDAEWLNVSIINPSK